ncbi:MAG: hypothetical protein V7K27_07260 [Nostoc sp.]|uniref:hypothetical protein n=1 Tax=Nostoc sp. TaxID=1180 RepID=UPI002FF59517
MSDWRRRATLVAPGVRFLTALLAAEWQVRSHRSDKITLMAVKAMSVTSGYYAL